ncbi:hypothetical protein [Paraglaciecola sp. 2405UD69-4]|uniref:hypothetical protein n=1 Tax=Paraglaciecola sp. 2405UD69-4 TaxID=3391836 RepID=UPI0039C8E4C7
MSPTFFTRTLITVAIILVVVGVLFNQSNTLSIKQSTQCNLNGANYCELTNQNTSVSVEFDQDIALEEELMLRIDLAPSLKIKQAWVQGINMYMGKTAVILQNINHESSKTSYHGVLFLGACSEPDMKWQLIVQTTDANGNTKSWFFNFETHRN